MNPWILFADLCGKGSMTAQFEAPGYPASNVNDWRADGPYRWKSTNPTGTLQWIQVALDSSKPGQSVALGTPIFCCVGGHNLQTAAPIYWDSGTHVHLAASADGGATWEGFPPAYLPFYGDPAWLNAPFVVSKGEPCPVDKPTHLRVCIETPGNFASPPQIGILTIGPGLVLPRGPQPGWDIDGETPLTDWNMNRGGAPLGSNFKGVEKNFTIKFDEPGFTESELWGGSGDSSWANFVVHARSKPFWFSPDGDRIWLVHLNGQFQNPRMAFAYRRTLSMPVTRFRV